MTEDQPRGLRIACDLPDDIRSRVLIQVRAQRGPSGATPANNPYARDHDRMSARICASVCAVAERPTGPAATEASPPNVNLLASDLSPSRRLWLNLSDDVGNARGNPALE